MRSGLLFAALCAALMLYFLVLKRRSPLPKVFVALLFGTGVLFALRPSLTSSLAALVGIGRGADLVLYLAVLFLVFVCFVLYIRSRETEDRLAEIVRSLALRYPVHTPGQGPAERDDRRDGSETSE